MSRQHPVASFPSSTWDGKTLTRDDVNVVKEPDADDWNRLVSELVATQTKIISLETAVAAATVVAAAATAAEVDTEILKIADATYGGGLTRKAKAIQGTATAATTFAIAVAIPTGCKLLAVQLRVDVILVSSDGGTAFTAAFDTGSTTEIGAAIAFAKNTKVDKMLDEITSGTTGITVTADSAKTFAAGGKVTAIVYYEELSAVDDAV